MGKFPAIFFLLAVMFSANVQGYAATPAQKNVSSSSVTQIQIEGGKVMLAPHQAKMAIEVPTVVPIAHSIRDSKTEVIMELKKKKIPRQPDLSNDAKHNKKPGGTNNSPNNPPNKTDKKKPTESNVGKVNDSTIIHNINYYTLHKKINRRKSIISTVSRNSTSSINPPKKQKNKNKPPPTLMGFKTTTFRPKPASNDSVNNFKPMWSGRPSGKNWNSTFDRNSSLPSANKWPPLTPTSSDY